MTVLKRLSLWKILDYFDSFHKLLSTGVDRNMTAATLLQPVTEAACLNELASQTLPNWLDSTATQFSNLHWAQEADSDDTV